MKLNNEYNFGVVPTVDTPRSRFLMHKNIRTTFNAAQLIPIYVNPLVQPGDTLKVKSTMVIRMTTPKFPTMDNLFADLRAFFIPHRVVWPHWKEMMGENNTGTWTQQTVYTVPQIAIYTTATGGNHKITKGDSLNYMGIPFGYPSAISTAPTVANCTTKISSLPLRAYIKTWNDWYRDENFVPPLYEFTDDTDRAYSTNAGSQWGNYDSSTGVYPNTCAPVYKFKDYFNACLPEPQKNLGGPVTLPIGQYAPISFVAETAPYTTGGTLKKRNGDAAPIVGGNESLITTPAGNGNLWLTNVTYPADQNTLTIDNSKNLIADLSNAVAATINAQRVAFAVQRIGELSARAGTRYPEVISAFFKVKGNLSAVVQRSQYLGGFRLPLSMNQVLQTSSTDSVSPQGNTAAYSLTIDSQNLFTHSFEEWGTLLFCLCVRQEHSYSQGIANFWNKKEKLDFYFPQMAYLGEQAIKTREIYADGSATDDSIFGYNERWIEYRTEQNINTGEMSVDYPQSLSVWHYGDDYTQAPVLSDAWRRETPDYIDRTLTVAHTVSDQFFMDSRFEFDKTSCIALRSIPGLLDHF